MSACWIVAHAWLVYTDLHGVWPQTNNKNLRIPFGTWRCRTKRNQVLWRYVYEETCKHVLQYINNSFVHKYLNTYVTSAVANFCLIVLATTSKASGMLPQYSASCSAKLPQSRNVEHTETNNNLALAVLRGCIGRMETGMSRSALQRDVLSNVVVFERTSQF